MFNPRSEKEIAQRVIDSRDTFLCFEGDVLVTFLSYDAAAPFRKEDSTITEIEWNEGRVPYAEAIIKTHMTDYMKFAWKKAEDHRGISASRSIDKMTAWLWLLGDDELLAEFETAPFKNYGCPQLAVICHKFGFPIPDSKAVQRMIKGQPCGADYKCGCGS